MRVHFNDFIDEASFEKLKSLAKEVTSEHLKENELKKQIKAITILVVRSKTKITREILELGAKGKLKLVIRAGAGLDNIDLESAKEFNIDVRSTGEASSNAVAELTLGLILGLSRNFVRADASMRGGEFLKTEFMGDEISGKTLGLIGFGHIGQLVAKKAKALGMKVLYTNNSGENKLFKGVCTYGSLEEVLGQSSYISLHLPALPGERPLLGEYQFKAMKQGVYIINTARGSLIDEEILLKYLNSGKVRAAALDVFKEEPPENKKIYTHEKITLTPHIGSQTKEAQRRVGEAVVSIVDNFIKPGDNFLNAD